MGSKLRTLTMPTVLSFLGIWSLAGCGGSGANTNQPPPPSDPIPTITSISPSSAAAGGVAFTLTVTGANFIAGSLVNFGGAAPASTFVNSTQLTADIPAAAIASAGMAAVTVTNPAPGGRTSNAANFTITGGGNPAPTINLLSPSCSPKGEQVLNPFVKGQLLVDGANFVSNSVVRWNGSDRPTTFVDSSRLTAQISASDIAAKNPIIHYAVGLLNGLPLIKKVAFLCIFDRFKKGVFYFRFIYLVISSC